MSQAQPCLAPPAPPKPVNFEGNPPTIQIIHTAEAKPCGDWDLDAEYARIVASAQTCGYYITTTSSMTLVTRLRLGVVQDGIKLYVQWGDSLNLAEVDEHGLIRDWDGARDVTMEMICGILDGGE